MVPRTYSVGVVHMYRVVFGEHLDIDCFRNLHLAVAIAKWFVTFFYALLGNDAAVNRFESQSGRENFSRPLSTSNFSAVKGTYPVLYITMLVL